MVSIPVGFSRSLQQPYQSNSVGHTLCFNPCRVFTLAATLASSSIKSVTAESFNPCRVFTLAATSRSTMIKRNASKGFNPCRVFTLAATPLGNRKIHTHTNSFNPCRVFTLAATFGFVQKTSGLVQVSIPVGFSRSLQRNGGPRSGYETPGFQSLSGFHARCNAPGLPGGVCVGAVSIPVGFSRSLQLSTCH